jgi:hypothetical protein
MHLSFPSTRSSATKLMLENSPQRVPEVSIENVIPAPSELHHGLPDVQ